LIVALTIILEIDDIQRFPSAKAFVSYCWLVPGAGHSGGKLRHTRKMQHDSSSRRRSANYTGHLHEIRGAI
jgi:transposase